MFGVDDAVVVGAGLTAAANLGGGILGANSAQAVNAMQVQAQRDANFANMTQFYDQMAFQRAWNQSNKEQAYDFAQSKYQWTVNDMRKAGLNPILAYQQGASPGSIGSGSGTSGAGNQGGVSGLQNPGESIQKGIANAVHSAVDAMRMTSGVELMKEQARTQREEQELKRRQQRNVDMDSAKKIEETFKTNAEIDVVKGMKDFVKANTGKAHADAAAAGAAANVTSKEGVNMDKYGSRQAPSTFERIMRTIFGGGVAAPNEGDRPRLEDIPSKRF